MKLRSFSIDQIMAFGPCLSREQVTRLYDGRKKMTARDALDLPIEPDQIVWAVTRPGVLPKTLLRRLLADIVERCLMRERDAGREPDARSWAVIPALRKYPGKNRMSEICADAYSAYAAAAASAASADAYSAAAYSAAAYSAAYADAYSAAAYSAAYADERRWQIDRLRQILDMEV